MKDVGKKKVGPPIQAAVSQSFKSILQAAYGKKHKTAVSKDSIVYVTVGDGPFASTVASEQFSSSYAGEGASKKDAENSAAKAAIEAEFPEAMETIHKQKAVAAQNSKAIMASKFAKATTWKSRLFSALAKQLKPQQLSAEEVVYETKKPEEGKPGFISTLTSPHLSHVYTSSKNKSKSEAEESVAKQAFAREFGAFFQALPDEVRSGKGFGPATGQKKSTELDPKQELIRGLSLFLGRPMTKEDMVVAFAEVGDKLIPTLSIQVGAAPQTYKGTAISKTATKEEKKAAEFVAVKAALAKNRPLFKVKLEEKEAKKKLASDEWRARLAQLKEEGKASIKPKQEK